ncbi:MAG: AmmeMemoRadiSam system protein B [Elusimicrobiota bacterium]
MGYSNRRLRIALFAAPLLAVAIIVPLLHCGGSSAPVDGDRVRPGILAGGWYPADPEALRHRLKLYLDRTGKTEVKGRVLGLVSPHAGYMYSGQAAAYGAAAIRGQKIRRVVVMGISHRYPLKGASVPEFTHYETPLGRIPVDQKACAFLRQNKLFGSYPNADRQEHSIEIQLPFLQAVLGKDFELVPIMFGELTEAEHAEAAAEVRKLLDEGTLLVASSDFVHYGSRFGYRPFERDIPKNIEALDRTALDAILKKDFKTFHGHVEKTGATICGHVPIGVLLLALPKDAKGSLLRYYRSGDMSGEWDGSVSYASVAFGPAISFKGSERETREAAMLDPEEQKEVVALARATVEAYVRGRKVPDEKSLEAKVRKGLKKDRGLFVTLRKHGELRGCIGDIAGREPLYKGVVANAVNAAVNDTRFSPVQAGELGDITVEVSILSPLKPAGGYRDILPGWHGVVLSKGRRGAVFLPQVAVEFGWEVEEFLSHLARKAGMGADDWREGAGFELFEAQIVPE